MSTAEWASERRNTLSGAPPSRDLTAMDTTAGRVLDGVQGDTVSENLKSVRTAGHTDLSAHTHTHACTHTYTNSKNKGKRIRHLSFAFVLSFFLGAHNSPWFLMQWGQAAERFHSVFWPSPDVPNDDKAQPNCHGNLQYLDEL